MRLWEKRAHFYPIGAFSRVYTLLGRYPRKQLGSYSGGHPVSPRGYTLLTHPMGAFSRVYTFGEVPRYRLGSYSGKHPGTPRVYTGTY